MEGIARRYEYALELIRDAGRLALQYSERIETLEVHTKGIQDMATEADLAVEQLIRGRLAGAFPVDDFLGEETTPSVSDSSRGIWVVDPIDGTQPFINGLRSWCVSVAYVRDARVQFGLVFNPAADELFAGSRSLGASCNGHAIFPSAATTLSEGLTYLGASPRVGPEQVVPVLDRLLRANGMFVRGGSGALGLCDVACGRLLGYVEAHVNSWDCLGAIGVLEGAGCRVSDFLSGDALLRGNRIVAGPPAVYDQLERLLEGIA